MATLSSKKLEDLRRELGPQLVSCDHVAPPPGVASGWPHLDRFLLWHGFPKSSVSLLISEAGGATTLWIKSAATITGKGQWVAWISDPETSLTPWSLRHRKIDLGKFLYIESPKDERQLLWALQEIMSLGLVEMIGCDLGVLNLREHQILKLKKLALRYSTALVFITRKAPSRLSSFFSLILRFQKDQVNILRALHRPTPHILERRDLYADTLPLLATGFRSLAI